MNDPKEMHGAETGEHGPNGSLGIPMELGAGLPASPQERVRYWCGLITAWRRRHGSRVPEPYLMGLSEAEYTAALDEVAACGPEHDGIGGLEAALTRVRRRVVDDGFDLPA
jgi:hypothetical protein